MSTILVLSSFAQLMQPRIPTPCIRYLRYPPANLIVLPRSHGLQSRRSRFQVFDIGVEAIIACSCFEKCAHALLGFRFSGTVTISSDKEPRNQTSADVIYSAGTATSGATQVQVLPELAVVVDRERPSQSGYGVSEAFFRRIQARSSALLPAPTSHPRPYRTHRPTPLPPHNMPRKTAHAAWRTP
jgi:hypothetical protein